ncbi:hypothetical protein [Fulvivirga sp.]|uniref:hypothetical protein n=1 Tax=Fulvivirga sp. TaxID=1931237 RepID=UPI0032ED2D86
MERTLALLILSIVIDISCTSKKNEEIKIDSLQVTADTIVQQDNSHAAPPDSNDTEPTGAFSFMEETFTEDELELAVTQELMNVLAKYDTGTYLTVKNEYTVTYQEEVDDGEFIEVNETKIKTWFYDSLNSLRCFTMDSQYMLGSDGYSNTNTIYLFRNDSLFAVYEDMEESIQVVSETHTRIVASHCPECGTFTSAAMSDSYQVNKLDSGYLEKISKTFFRENDPNFRWLNKLDVKMEGENYVTAQDESGDGNIIRTVEYTINPYLFKEFIRQDNP